MILRSSEWLSSRFVRAALACPLAALLIVSGAPSADLIGGTVPWVSGVQAASPEASAKARAKALYDEARVLHEAGDTEAALSKLDAAYKEFPSDAILVSIVNRHLDLGQPEDAAAVLGTISTDARRIRSQTVRLRAEVDRMLAAPVPVRLSADAPDATVSIDSGPVRSLPTTLNLPRGTHRFLFRASGRQDALVVEELRGVRLTSIQAALTPAQGSWQVRVEPGTLEDVRVMIGSSVVLMSDRERQKSISDPRETRAGTLSIICLRGLDDRAEATIEVRSGAVATATCDLPIVASSSDLEVPAWVMLGLGVASAVAGAALMGEWGAKEAEFGGIVNAAGEPVYEVDPTNAYIGGGLLGLGVISGVVSGILFAVDGD